jgi:hypothetical protein
MYLHLRMQGSTLVISEDDWEGVRKIDPLILYWIKFLNHCRIQVECAHCSSIRAWFSSFFILFLIRCLSALFCIILWHKYSLKKFTLHKFKLRAMWGLFISGPWRTNDQHQSLFYNYPRYFPFGPNVDQILVLWVLRKLGLSAVDFYCIFCI